MSRFVLTIRVGSTEFRSADDFPNARQAMIAAVALQESGFRVRVTPLAGRRRDDTPRRPAISVSRRLGRRMD